MRKEVLLILAKRIFSSAVILFLMITFLFFLLRISPGDPTLKFVAPDLSPRLASLVKDSFGLNNSLTEQYTSFLLNAIKGNFGISYTYQQPVLNVIGEYLPFTLMFSFSSFLIQMFFAFLLAFVSFRRANKLIDRSLSQLSLIVYATPSFVIGVFLIFVFSELLHLFPSSGVSSYGASHLSLLNLLGDYALHITLPLLTLSIPGIAVYFKYLRENLEEVSKKSFVENLRSYGFSDNEIIRKHIIPNAVSPLISVAGVELGVLFGGALITEVIFALPGMGRLTVNAIFARDYPLIVGCTFISGVLVIVTNLLADVIKAFIDKRVIKEILN